jgi:hypothetical protein
VAKELYRKLGCGKDAIITRIAGQVSYENRWTELAEGGVRSALLAKHKAAWVDEKIKDAKLTGRYKHRHGHKILIRDFYLCRDGWLIVWPAWAEQSRQLPDKLTSDNWREFLPIVRELVRIYLFEDEKRTREYLEAAAPRRAAQKYGPDDSRKNAWDADTFNNLLSKKVKSALKSLASR